MSRSRSASNAGLAQLAAWGATMLVLAGLVLQLDLKTMVLFTGAMLGGMVYLSASGRLLVSLIVLRALLDIVDNTSAVGGLPLAQAVTGGLTLAIAVRLLLDLPKLSELPVGRSFLAWTLLILISGLREPSVRVFAMQVKMLGPPVIVCMAMAATYQRREDLLWCLLPMTFVGIIPVLGDWYAIARGQTVSLAYISRYTGLYGEGIHSAAYAFLLYAGLGAYWSSVGPKRWQRVLGLGLAVASVPCVVYTYVRTGLMGLIGLVITYLALERRWGVLLGAVLLGFTAVSSSSQLQERFSDVVVFLSEEDLESEDEELGSGRLSIWSISLENYGRTEPYEQAFGVGLTKHTRLSPSGHHDSHNDYLGLLFQLGPLGPLIWLMMQAQIVRVSLWVRKHTDLATDWHFANLVIALHATSFVTNNLSNAFIRRMLPSWYLWAMSGLMLGIWVRMQRERKAAETEQDNDSPARIASR